MFTRINEEAILKSLFFAFIFTLASMSCTPAANTATAIVTTDATGSTLAISSATSSTTVKPTSIPTYTTTPSLTPTNLPDYSNLPPLAQLAVTKNDLCLTQYWLPIITVYDNAKETDLTSSINPKYCAIDCVQRRWTADNGASFTFTILRVASPMVATSLLKEELDRVQQLYADREKYIGVGFDDPYTGEGDNSWAGKPYPGLTGYTAVVRSTILIVMEWIQVPQGVDLEFDFGMTEEFTRLQFQKMDNALGTPFPLSANQEKCKP